jgi:hypothetical protein
MLAMFNLNYNKVKNLNTFNYISKNRYLSWMDKSSMFSDLKKQSYTSLDNCFKFNPIIIKKMPMYIQDLDLNDYSLCSCFNNYK